jgi:hypothetical protein
MKMLNTEGMYAEMAEAVATYDLKCDRCERANPLTKEDSACYLKSGWPKCCGSTMKLTPRK